jgi:hypothetical protein
MFDPMLDRAGVESREMSGRDVAQIVCDLEKVGLRLSVIRRLDGSLRLDRWRTMSYWSNANDAERLWSDVVGDDPAVMEALAAYIENQVTLSAMRRLSSGSEATAGSSSAPSAAA